MKTLFSLIFAVLLSLVYAHAVEIDGICYYISGDEAIVTLKNLSDYDYEPSYFGEVVIPSSITYDGKTYSVTSIGESAFIDCSRLTSVTIPGSVKSIGRSAFMGCSGLTSVTMGDGVTSIGSSAFMECRSLTSVNIPNSVTIVDDYTFEDCTGLTSVTIPGSVKSINKSAFNGCSSLTSLEIGDGVTSIGDAAFGGCTSLTSVDIPNSLTSIGVSVFYECTSLASVTVPESVTSIGRQAFHKTVWYDKQPDGLIYLGKVAYKYKGEMPEETQIEIKDGTTQIAGEAFYHCTGLVSINIPNSVTSIDGYAFQGCTGLTTVTLPEGLTNIGEYTFCGCRNLVSVNIPDGVTEIHDYTFHNCTRLASVAIPDGVKNIGSHGFSKCSSLVSVTIPESVTSIGDFAFFRCSGLTSLPIPSGVTIINFSSFYGCSGIKSFTIPSSVKTIDKGAFANCSEMTDMFCYAENVPNADEITFEGTPISVATLHVPEGSVEKYKKSLPWSSFGNIVALTTSVTYTEGQMATIILPTEPDASKGKYYKLDRCEDGQIVFAQELLPQARTPYIIVPNQDFSVEVKESELEGLNRDSVSIGDVTFIGSYVRTELPALTGGAEGRSFYIDIIDTTPDCHAAASDMEMSVVGALRAYLIVKWDDPINHGGAKGEPTEEVGIVLFDDETGIDGIQNSEFKNQNEEGSIIYDLSGRKIVNSKSSNSKSQRGIYIENGRKVVR